MSGASFWKGGGKPKGPSRPVSSIVPIWHGRCQLDNHGNPISNLFNACLALREDPQWQGKINFDQMLRAVAFPVDPLEDPDVFLVREWMQNHGLRRIATEDVRQALVTVAHEHPVHPLRKRLDSVIWDGKKRVNQWISRGLGTKNSPYYREIARRWLIAMIARIYDPGCKCDYMLVLEGPQGTLKSQACRLLAQGYFSDTLPNLSTDHVRVSMHIRGKWLIEVSEFSAFDRAHHNLLKSFLTTQAEQYTPKHARQEVHEPRQCLFIGTTNDKEYLHDITGARRYWPVECGKLNLRYIETNIDQLLAEARNLYQKGERWWPASHFEDIVMKPIQASRFEVDAWQHPILDWLTGKPETTLHALAAGALKLNLDRIGIRETRRITGILRSFGWELKRSTDGRRIWIPTPRQ